MGKPKKKDEQLLGPLPTIGLLLGGVGFCLIHCQIVGIILGALALGIGWRDLVHSRRYKWLTGRRQAAGYVIIAAVFVPWTGYVVLGPLSSQPNLIVKLTEITLVGENDTHPTGNPKPGIVLAMSVRNAGGREATIVGAVLVPEGKAVSQGTLLLLTPDKLTIRVGDVAYTLRGEVRTDKVQDYRGMRATVVLRDSMDRRYKSTPIVILPGGSEQPTGK